MTEQLEIPNCPLCKKRMEINTNNRGKFYLSCRNGNCPATLKQDKNSDTPEGAIETWNNDIVQKQEEEQLPLPICPVCCEQMCMAEWHDHFFLECRDNACHAVVTQHTESWTDRNQAINRWNSNIKPVDMGPICPICKTPLSVDELRGMYRLLCFSCDTDIHQKLWYNSESEAIERWEKEAT